MVPSNIPFPSAKASGSGQASVDWYDLPSDDEDYLTPKMWPKRQLDEAIVQHMYWQRQGSICIPRLNHH